MRDLNQLIVEVEMAFFVLLCEGALIVWLLTPTPFALFLSLAAALIAAAIRYLSRIL